MYFLLHKLLKYISLEMLLPRVVHQLKPKTKSDSMIINNSEGSSIKLPLSTCGGLVFQPAATCWNLRVYSDCVLHLADTTNCKCHKPALCPWISLVKILNKVSRPPPSLLPHCWKHWLLMLFKSIPGYLILLTSNSKFSMLVHRFLRPSALQKSKQN